MLPSSEGCLAGECGCPLKVKVAGLHNPPVNMEYNPWYKPELENATNEQIPKNRICLIHPLAHSNI